MKWKITIRFILAVLAVSIVSNLISVFMSLYYSYEEYNVSQVFNGIFSAVVQVPSKQDTPSTDQPRGYSSIDVVTIQEEQQEADITIHKTPEGYVKTFQFDVSELMEGETITISQTLADTLKSSDGWIQVIDREGEEIESVNKPLTIKTSYTQYELEKAANSPMEMNEYVITVTYPEQKESDALAYVIGVPKPDTDLNSMISYQMHYFRYMDRQQLITSAVTLLIALVLGYLLAIRLNRPVVQITDGITAMANGNYDVQFSQDSFYGDVYKSLNHMATALKSGELEREKMEKIREDWITNISHDLKTPLSSIKGYGELLYESGKELSPEELQNYTRVILDKSVYMDALIDDLKLTQKLKSDLIPLKIEKVNLVDFLREIVIGILNDPKYENRIIHFDSDETEISMEFDPLLYKRAFTNILMNAVVHNSCETLIWVQIRHDNRVYVEIKDNGKGISDTDSEKLFERYYRGTSTNESYAGSGLGLAIAREIIEAHGGNIELESRSGEGTLVRIFV